MYCDASASALLSNVASGIWVLAALSNRCEVQAQAAMTATGEITTEREGAGGGEEAFSDEMRAVCGSFLKERQRKEEIKDDA